MTLLLSFCDHFSLTFINHLLPRLLSVLVCLRLLSMAYHWRELPQVLLLSRQNDKYVFVTSKHVFCRDKSMLAATKYFCRDKYLSQLKKKKNVFRDKLTFVGTKLCLSQQNICRDKHVFISTNILFVCRDERFVAASIHLPVILTQSVRRLSMNTRV